MKLENVFYGFTKDGKRRLLWKRFKIEYTDLGDVGRTVYFDLEKKEYIDPNEVDETTLVSINRLVGDVQRMRNRKVINAYKADCDLLYDVTGAFYGDVVNKTTIYDLKSANGHYMGSGRNDLYDDAFVSEEKNVLFARIDDTECRVQSVYTGCILPWVDRIKRGIGVKEVRPINKHIFDKNVVTKKKLLEADYRKKL